MIAREIEYALKEHAKVKVVALHTSHAKLMRLLIKRVNIDVPMILNVVV